MYRNAIRTFAPMLSSESPSYINTAGISASQSLFVSFVLKSDFALFARAMLM